jgi:menaquinone-dependent protoporphyrinogen oxidase
MKAVRVLVACTSRHDATASIADWIADELRHGGVLVDVRPAADVHFLDGYDAVILGGVLHFGVWHSDARRFAFWHRHALRGLQVWLFSSGGDDDGAEVSELPPDRGILRIARHLGARACVSFAGADEARVRAWARDVSRQLSMDERHAAVASER